MSLEALRQKVFMSVDVAHDLHGQVSRDRRRHIEKVKEAIKENLGQIIGNESIITSDGKTIVKVPIRSLELPDFRYGKGAKKDQIGQGSGGTQVGDIIGQDVGQGQGRGPGAGDQPGIDYYEAEIMVDQLKAWLFEQLGLPWLENRGKALIPSEEIHFRDIRKKGPMSNLDKRRTIMENIRRNALSGNPRFKDITDDDTRFRTWEMEERQVSQAVAVFIRDVSGSMGEFEKYITRSLATWSVGFLRTHYEQTEMVFIAHHTQARIVGEMEFFHLGESGGTLVSPAYELLTSLQEKYPPSEWNVYPFHFTDGDNWGTDDDARCRKLISNGLDSGLWNMFGFAEIKQDKGESTLLKALREITSPRFVFAKISREEEVLSALRGFFTADKVLESSAVGVLGRG